MSYVEKTEFLNLLAGLPKEDSNNPPTTAEDWAQAEEIVPIPASAWVHVKNLMDERVHIAEDFPKYQDIVHISMDQGTWADFRHLLGLSKPKARIRRPKAGLPKTSRIPTE